MSTRRVAKEPFNKSNILANQIKKARIDYEGYYNYPQRTIKDTVRDTNKRGIISAFKGRGM
jgi:hypothetical protein